MVLVVFNSSLKRCTKCGEVFDAEKDPETDWSDLQCPYLDCDGEGTIVKADLSDRYSQWMHDKHKQYIFWRGKARVAVKDLYWRPVRRYNAIKRGIKKLFESDPRQTIDLDDMSEEDMEMLKEKMQEQGEDVPMVTGEASLSNRCPNCHAEADEVAEVGEEEYRCEHCIGGT